MGQVRPSAQLPFRVALVSLPAPSQTRIYDELRNASVVLLLLSSSSSDSKWLKQEIAAAQSMGKPLVVVRARGYSGPIPCEVTESADIIAGWNAGAIADRVEQMLAQAA